MSKDKKLWPRHYRIMMFANCLSFASVLLTLVRSKKVARNIAFSIFQGLVIRATATKYNHWGDEQKEVPVQKRPVHGQAYPEALEAMLALSRAVQKTGLAPQLIDLVNYRVSQLNGCAYCLDMHSKDLRARG
jgi:AhpD family alkylhydroperoxidase